jgi:predicted transposase YbfD/YdcC
MSRPLHLTIHEHFADLPDPRVERTRVHELLDVVTIATCAVICGADSWVEVELFGTSKQDWFASFLRLPGGIPSHDTFGRVFARLDPDAFVRGFMSLVRSALPDLEHEIVAMDGKALCGAHAAGDPPRLLVSAYATSARLVLGQLSVDATSNEITALPALLELLDLSGSIVTADAIHCQTTTAQALLDADADYVLRLKRNQPETHAAVAAWVAEAERQQWRQTPHQVLETVDTAHGRYEVRRYWTTTDPELLAYLNPDGRWPGLASVGVVRRTRETARKTSVELAYYLSSLDGDVRTFAEAARRHWGIENGQHWILDVAFREDESRVRVDHGAENVATLRRIALNLLRQDTTTKAGTKAKRLKAGWDERFLLRLLSQ